jgi:hypothetical protein
MGKFIDTSKRGRAEAEKIVKQIATMAKRGSPYFDVSVRFDGNTCYVQVNNDNKYARDMADFVRATQFCKMTGEAAEYEGFFDWSADVYIKPCSTIEFTW